MIKFKQIACLCIVLLFSITSNAQTKTLSTISVNGSQDNINFATCSSIQPINFFFNSIRTYESNVSSAQSFSYEINFYRNGNQIDSKTYNSGDQEINCSGLIICPNIYYTFDNVEPLSGYYYAKIIIRRYILGFYVETLVTEQTNTIVVTRPDDGLYSVCSGSDYDNSFSRCQDVNEIYQFVPGEYFFVQKNAGMIYKFSSLGSSGDNVWGLSFNPPANLPGYSNLIGYNDFNTPITDMVYTSDGKTIISFNDGKILKINGTGGSGANMFAVTESTTGFANISPYNYYSGHHKFLSGITDLFIKDNKLFISCINKGMLKINGSGGSGANMFAITETPTSFSSLPGYNYYSGHSYFLSPVNEVFSVGSFMFVSTLDGKLLKINNTGGTGANMFAITETTSGYSTIPSYNFYSGHSKFMGPVSEMYSNGTYLFLGFYNGKILKINGTGGSGANMFAVSENASGFSGIPSYNYYVGYSNYSSAINKITHNPSGNRLFITFGNGKIMKVFNSGGTGANMFNATEVLHGFVTTSGAYATQLEGSAHFASSVTDIDFYGNTQMICLANNKVLKINGNGGSGANMYAVAQTGNGFRPLLGYTQYLTGSQLFSCQLLVLMKKEASVEEDEAFAETEEPSLAIKVYPNPFEESISLSIPVELQTSDVAISLVDINGRVLLTTAGNQSGTLDTSYLPSGFYLVVVKQNDVLLHTSRVVKN